MVEVAGSRDAVTSHGGQVRVVVRASIRRRRHVVLLMRVDDADIVTYIHTERLRGTLDVVVYTPHSLTRSFS